MSKHLSISLAAAAAILSSSAFVASAVADDNAGNGQTANPAHTDPSSPNRRPDAPNGSGTSVVNPNPGSTTTVGSGQTANPAHTDPSSPNRRADDGNKSGTNTAPSSK